MSAAIPDPRSLNPMDAFIGQLLPEWLKPSSPAACRALHDAYRAYHGSLVGLQQAMSLLQDPQTFARTRLEAELRARLGLNLDLRQVAWRER